MRAVSATWPKPASPPRNATRRRATLVETAKSIKDDLRDLTVDALAQKVASLTARIARYRQERPTEPPLPASHDAAELVALEAGAELQQRREELDRLEKDLARAKEDVQALDLGDASNKARLEQAQIAAAQEQRSLAEARGVTSGRGDRHPTGRRRGDPVDPRRRAGRRAATSWRRKTPTRSRNSSAMPAPCGHGWPANCTTMRSTVRELRTKLSLLGRRGAGHPAGRGQIRARSPHRQPRAVGGPRRGGQAPLRNVRSATNRGASPLRRPVPRGHRIARSSGLRILARG